MIKISFEADTKTKLYEEMIKYLGLDEMAKKAQQVLDSEPVEDKPTETLKKVRKAKKKAAKKKEEPKLAGRPPVDQEKELAIKKGEIVSKSAVSDALQKLNIAKGLEICKSVLDEYECKRVGDLPEEMYKDFVASCEAQMV